MPLVNPNIALAAKPIQFESPVNMLSQAYQLQSAAQANQLNQMKMAEYERARQEEEGVRNYLLNRDVKAPEAQAGLLQFGKTGLEYAKQLQAQQAAATQQRSAQLKLQTDLAEAAGRIYMGVKDQATWDAAKPKLAALGGDASQLPAVYDPQYVASELSQAQSVKDQFEMIKPKVEQVRAGDRIVFRDTNPRSPTFGKEILPSERMGMAPGEAERIKLEGQRLGLEGRRVAVLEENQRRDADPAFQQRMAGAKAVGEAIAKGDVAAQQALPKIINRAEEGLRLIDELVGKQEVRDKNGKVIQAATKPHPGFENAVGTTWLPGARFVPGTDAADFMSRFDQIKGASFLEAFESLKGGGAITEKEGAKATDAINRMSTSQSEREFMAAARDLQEVIRKGVANAQRKAAGGGAAPAAAPAAAGGVKFLGFE